MEGYQAAENIYWAFSSSAQAVAAFIGFISAGFFFSHDRMDRAVERDETLLEIYKEIKDQHFKNLRNLLWFTGASIVFSLVVVFLNGFDTGCVMSGFALLVAALNIYTITKAVLLVIAMVDPGQVEKTADKLIVESTGEVSGGSPTKTITKGEFLEKFIELEQLARKTLESRAYEQSDGAHGHRFLPFSEVIRQLSQLKVINWREAVKLMEVSKMRNLVSHGQLENIENRGEIALDELIQTFKNL
ncbi:hypothetical protein [Chryseobacterium sp. SIMBA_029]|uniref:hypothetical protein n=1 Tax=Chryseobacterium sp. SIMBA_029 TaxID=3085772 RepID=UPI003977E661